MKSVIALSVLGAIAAAAPAVADQSPGNVRIKSVGYAGTGCPQGSAYAQIADNGATMTVLFDSYVASTGPGSGPRDQRKACTLNLEVLYPSGYQFSIFNVRTQGYINTDAGVTGQVRNSYFFSGRSGVASSTTTIPGNTHGSWNKQDKVNSDSVVLSPCGGQGTVNIQTSIALQSNNPSAKGYISTDSIDAGFDQKFRQDYGLDWVKCTSGDAPQQIGNPNVPPPSSPFDDGSDSGPAPAPFTPPSPSPFTPPSSPFSNPYASNPFGSNPFASNPYASNPYASNPYAANPFNQPASPWTTVTQTNGWPF